MRILLADDNERIRRGVRAILSSSPNFEICAEAADGRETIRIARELLPDLILLDVSMPEMDGLQATRLLRAALPSVKIVIMSQHDPAHLLPNALAAGANACVDKSSLATDLLAVISTLDGVPDDNRTAHGD
ncbi:MAG TPA: response regulator transcription factor [Candidatus Acidoferrum sp.]|jgi:DNA-binding NarL/FixJ family response regulator